MAPRLKTIKINGNENVTLKKLYIYRSYLFKKVLNMANHYIFKCKRLTKVENVGRMSFSMN